MYLTTYGYDGNQPPIDLILEEQMMPMRDGVRLYTLIVRPADKEKVPLILQRNPYSGIRPVFQETCDWFYTSFQNGFGFVLQHCRGTARSEGKNLTYQQEEKDGLDTLDALCALPYSNGEIYPNGGSYLSSVHLAYLKHAPACIKGCVLAVQDDIRYRIAYRNGFLKCGLHGGWFAKMYDIKNTGKNYTEDSFRTLPLIDFSKTVFGEPVSLFDNVLMHPDENDPYWQTEEGGGNFVDALNNLDVPVLLFTSWFDIYTGGIIDMWNRMPQKLKEKSALVITPFDHGYPGGGSKTAYPNAKLDDVWNDYCQDWINFAAGIKEQPDFVEPGNVKYYRINEGKWVSAERVDDGKEQKILFLNSDGKLTSNTSAGEVSYIYNPYAPASFKGGCCCNFGGSQEQDPPNSRYDIKSFLTAPLEESFLMQGKSGVKLTVKSDCEDTCFYVRLSIVHNGIAHGLRDDITSICKQYPDYVPGTEVDLEFMMDEIALRFMPGDQIRLDVSSSAWPHYVPHTNCKGPYALQRQAKIAHNTIITGNSALILNTEA
ncbi:MAG: CocE/NonD family hydrolase [Lentisphaeria bacterium]|nr:CocE/NonD family hydrolase [Lentisphaeria bacterium]